MIRFLLKYSVDQRVQELNDRRGLGRQRKEGGGLELCTQPVERWNGGRGQLAVVVVVVVV